MKVTTPGMARALVESTLTTLALAWLESTKADLLEDAGLSTSPIVDIGQVEGAFVTGLGLWTRSVDSNTSSTALHCSIVLINHCISVRRLSTILRRDNSLQCKTKISGTCYVDGYCSGVPGILGIDAYSPGTLGSTSPQQPRTSLRTSESPFCPMLGTRMECFPQRCI